MFKIALECRPNVENKVVIRTDKRPAGTHDRSFKLQQIYKVAILIVDENLETRDTVLICSDTGQLQHIYETRRSYDMLQYPLMF